jgi:3-methyladenine DNA glycosylase/8-oxoguanine DNA glycosylase
VDFDCIHSTILKNSSPFPFLSKEIKNNGRIFLKENKLDFFSFLIKTIISQQISDKAAESIWGRFCKILDIKYPCYKSFPNLHFLKESLEKSKVSKQKKSYICSIYNSILERKIVIKNLLKMEEKDFRKNLIKVKGIGPWTCDMILIFFLNKPNILPENDLVIRKTIEKIQKTEKKKINFRQTFKPFLSILSLHLWKMSKRVL